MRRVINAHESGSLGYSVGSLYVCLRRLTVRIYTIRTQRAYAIKNRRFSLSLMIHGDGGSCKHASRYALSFESSLSTAVANAFDRSRSLKRSSVIFSADRTATVRVGCSGILLWIVVIISSTYVATRRVKSSLSPRRGYSEPKIFTLMLFLSGVIRHSLHPDPTWEPVPLPRAGLQVRINPCKQFLHLGR